MESGELGVHTHSSVKTTTTKTSFEKGLSWPLKHTAPMGLQEKHSKMVRNTDFVICVQEPLLVNYLLSLSFIFLTFKMV